MGNELPALAGFFLASKGSVNGTLLIFMVIGLSLVIGSACAFNNYQDRGIDALMARTRSRPSVTGRVSPGRILIFASLLGLLGITILALHTNMLTAALALFGLLAYVIPYGYYKRRTEYGTLIGSISGAMPPVVGYVAVSGHIDAAAVILFLILVTWQMPHFFAIAMYRASDYAAAGIPVLPRVRGLSHTRHQMIGFIIAFIIATSALAFWRYTGPVYLVTSLLLGLSWLAMTMRGFTSSNPKPWAKGMFRYSLVVLTVLCLVISLDNVIR
jgi:protoheme IX farnesyltransferase